MELNGNKARPVVNINGDSASDLIEYWQEVKIAAQSLQHALRNVMPHGRNYQTLPDDRTYKEDRAMFELMARFARDVEMYAEATQIDVYDQTLG